MSTWLKNNNHIKTVTRDRVSAYAKVIEQELRGAMQISDRFHIHQNLLQTIKKALNKEVPSSIKIRNNLKDTSSSNDNEPSKKMLQTMDNFTSAEQIHLNPIHEIQEMGLKGHSISEISRLLGKDRRTIKKYIIGNLKDLCKFTVKINNPYEDKDINLVNAGYIEKQIVNILISYGYNRTMSNAIHMIHKVVKDNNLIINKYSPVTNSVNTSNGARDMKYIYISRTCVFKYLLMDGEISEIEKNYIYNNYPKIFELKKCINEFLELFKRKILTLLYIFIDKYKDIDIPEITSFTSGLLRDLEAIENSVSSNLGNGFVEGTNSKLKMIKRTMYGRCSKELLAAKLMLCRNG